MLDPAAAQALQRVEADSDLDLDSYLHAKGKTKYDAVKETEIQQLLCRAKKKLATDHLDPITVKRAINLASAKASRERKKYLTDLLYLQMKQKNHDALCLAKQLRRDIALFEQLISSNHHLARNLTEQREINSRIKFAAQGDNHVNPSHDTTYPLGKLFERPSPKPLSICTTYMRLDQTMPNGADDDMNSAFFVGGRNTQDEPHAQGQQYEDAPVEDEPVEDGLGCCLSTEELKLEQQTIIDGGMEFSDFNDYMKTTDTEMVRVASSDVLDVDDLYTNNPSDHFAVAG